MGIISTELVDSNLLLNYLISKSLIYKSIPIECQVVQANQSLAAFLRAIFWQRCFRPPKKKVTVKLTESSMLQN